MRRARCSKADHFPRAPLFICRLDKALRFKASNRCELLRTLDAKSPNLLGFVWRFPGKGLMAILHTDIFWWARVNYILGFQRPCRNGRHSRIDRQKHLTVQRHEWNLFLQATINYEPSFQLFARFPPHQTLLPCSEVSFFVFLWLRKFDVWNLCRAILWRSAPSLISG